MGGKSFEAKRFSVSLPEPIFKELEEKRGPVNRSSYIREVLKDWWGEGHSLDDLRGGDSCE